MTKLNLYGQYDKLSKEQKDTLNNIAWLAKILKNNKLWRKYWATKRDYLLIAK